MEYLVKYNGKNFHGVHFCGRVIAKKYVHGGQKIFQGGINKITEEEWEKLHTKDEKGNLVLHPAITHMLETGKLEWKKGHCPDDNSKDSGKISKMASPTAIKFVNDTTDLNVLKDWNLEEKRPEVVKAIKNQVDKLTKVDTKKKDEEKAEDE